VKRVTSLILAVFAMLAQQWVQCIKHNRHNTGCYQKQIESALSPVFAEARTEHSALIEKRSKVQQAIVIYKRVQGLKRRLDEPNPAPPPEKLVEKGDASEFNQYSPKSVLGAFSKTVEQILQEWYFPSATNVYFDEGKRDVVIGTGCAVAVGLASELLPIQPSLLLYSNTAAPGKCRIPASSFLIRRSLLTRNPRPTAEISVPP
jgi:hypothetical protein